MIIEGVKIKAFRNEAGWNSVYVAGKIIKKIGPILAIKSKDFNTHYVAEKITRDISLKNQNIKVKGIEINSKKIKKGFIFFAIKGHKLNGEKFINEAIKKGRSCNSLL